MNIFRIKKKSGTYSELLETYGLANTLHKIFDSLDIFDVDIFITDKSLYYEVTTNVDIMENMIEGVNYFPLFKFIKQKEDSDVSNVSSFYDYPTQRLWKKEKDEALQKIRKEYAGKPDERNNKIRKIETVYEEHKPIDIEYDVYSQICSPNNYSSFDKLYKNFSENKDVFGKVLLEVLKYYNAESSYNANSFDEEMKGKAFEKNITATQLYNPSQGQGVNKQKADGLNRMNFKPSWITETMKISGALSDMICKLVKVGDAYDLKLFVPEYKQVNFTFKAKLIPDFKKYLKGNTPIKIDILYALLLTQKIIEHDEFSGKRKKVKDIVSGLHSVYQKDMGQNKAVMNISFIQIPNFIEINNKDENQKWIEILEEQKRIIGSMDENKGAIQGLMKYRNFISASKIDSFFDFSFWYATYLSSKFSNKQYAIAFSVKSLNKLYSSMDKPNLKLMEIIENRGFQAIAKAIRMSTVLLQYAPKNERKFEIRYGVAQTLQTKSKSSEGLATFIGEFISRYNAEAARYMEKNGNPLRANVRMDELCEFYALLDKYPSCLVGALLASYGFALQTKENNNENNNFEETIIEE